MGGEVFYMDTILVPISLFITIGYHAYLWHNLKNNPRLTTIGMNFLRRRLIFQDIQPGDLKVAMLSVQSLRNNLMETILTATITILISVALAALTNNTYNANHLFSIMTTSTSSLIFGLHSAKIIIIKYGTAAIFLLFSFSCSSMALGSLIDSNFLINSAILNINDDDNDDDDEDDDDDDEDHLSFSSALEYTLSIMERGSVLALAGSRLLCITFPLLLWMFSPLLVAISSLALVWGLYGLDYIR